jgi:hypothetical protein
MPALFGAIAKSHGKPHGTDEGIWGENKAVLGPGHEAMAPFRYIRYPLDTERPHGHGKRDKNYQHLPRRRFAAVQRARGTRHQDSALLSGLILRASIASPKGIPEFQAAVSFDRPLLIVDFPPKRDTGKPPAVSLKPPLPGPSLTDGSESLRQPYQDEASEIIAAFLAINFCKSPDAVQDEMLKLNDW